MAYYSDEVTKLADQILGIDTKSSTGNNPYNISDKRIDREYNKLYKKLNPSYAASQEQTPKDIGTWAVIPDSYNSDTVESDAKEVEISRDYLARKIYQNKIKGKVIEESPTGEVGTTQYKDPTTIGLTPTDFLTNNLAYAEDTVDDVMTYLFGKEKLSKKKAKEAYEAKKNVLVNEEGYVVHSRNATLNDMDKGELVNHVLSLKEDPDADRVLYYGRVNNVDGTVSYKIGVAKSGAFNRTKDEERGKDITYLWSVRTDDATKYEALFHGNKYMLRNRRYDASYDPEQYGAGKSEIYNEDFLNLDGTVTLDKLKSLNTSDIGKFKELGINITDKFDSAGMELAYKELDKTKDIYGENSDEYILLSKKIANIEHTGADGVGGGLFGRAGDFIDGVESSVALGVAGIGDAVLDAVVPGNSTLLDDLKDPEVVDKYFGYEGRKFSSKAGRLALRKWKKGDYLGALFEAGSQADRILADSSFDIGLLAASGGAGVAIEATNAARAAEGLAALSNVEKSVIVAKDLLTLKNNKGLATFAVKQTNNQIDERLANGVEGDDVNLATIAGMFASNYTLGALDRFAVKGELGMLKGVKDAIKAVPTEAIPTLAKKAGSAVISLVKHGAIESAQEFVQTYGETINSRLGTTQGGNNPFTEQYLDEATKGALLGFGAGSLTSVVGKPIGKIVNKASETYNTSKEIIKEKKDNTPRVSNDELYTILNNASDASLTAEQSIAHLQEYEAKAGTITSPRLAKNKDKAVQSILAKIEKEKLPENTTVGSRTIATLIDSATQSQLNNETVIGNIEKLATKAGIDKSVLSSIIDTAKLSESSRDVQSDIDDSIVERHYPKLIKALTNNNAKGIAKALEGIANFKTSQNSKIKAISDGIEKANKLNKDVTVEWVTPAGKKHPFTVNSKHINSANGVINSAKDTIRRLDNLESFSSSILNTTKTDGIDETVSMEPNTTSSNYQPTNEVVLPEEVSLDYKTGEGNIVKQPIKTSTNKNKTQPIDNETSVDKEVDENGNTAEDIAQMEADIANNIEHTKELEAQNVKKGNEDSAAKRAKNIKLINKLDILSASKKSDGNVASTKKALKSLHAKKATSGLTLISKSILEVYLNSDSKYLNHATLQAVKQVLKDNLITYPKVVDNIIKPIKNKKGKIPKQAYIYKLVDFKESTLLNAGGTISNLLGKLEEEYNKATNSFTELFNNAITNLNGEFKDYMLEIGIIDNGEIALAMQLRGIESITSNSTLLNKNKTLDGLANMLGKTVEELTEDDRNLLDKGMFLSSVVDSIGKSVLKDLGVTKSDEVSEVQYSGLVATIGQASILMLANQGKLEIHKVRKNDGSNEEYTTVSLPDGDIPISDYTQVLDEYITMYEFEKSKNPNIPSNTPFKSKQYTWTVTKSNTNTQVSAVRVSTVNKLLKEKWVISHASMELLNSLDTDVIKQKLGYKSEAEIEELPYMRRVEALGKNIQIDNSVAFIDDGTDIFDKEDYLDENGKGLKFYFDYFIGRNYRTYIKSSIFNPQNDTFIRFLVTPEKNTDIEFDKNNSKDMLYFKAAVVQGFGYDIDKYTPLGFEKQVNEWFDDINKKSYQDYIDGFKDAKISSKGVGHYINAMQSLKDYQEESSNTFKSSPLIETDHKTSGFALKLLQYPVLESMDKDLERVGITSPDTKSFIDRDIEDSYENNAKSVFNIEVVESIVESELDDKNDYVLSSINSHGLLSVVDPEIGVTGAMRNFMKPIFMVFNYSAGIPKLQSMLSANLVDDMVDKLVATPNEYTDLIEILESTYKIDNLITQLKEKPLDRIITNYAGGKSNLGNELKSKFGKVYNIPLKTTLENNYGEFIDINKLVIGLFEVQNNIFLEAYNKFNPNSEKSIEEVDIWLKEKKDLIPHIPTADGGTLELSATSKVQTTESNVPKLKLKGEKQISVDGKRQKMMNVHPTIKKFIDLGASGAVITIQHEDAVNLAETMNKYPHINGIFDATVLSPKYIEEVTAFENKSMYDMSKEYSILDELVKVTNSATGNSKETTKELIRNTYLKKLEYAKNSNSKKPISEDELVKEAEAEVLELVKLIPKVKEARKELFNKPLQLENMILNTDSAYIANADKIETSTSSRTELLQLIVPNLFDYGYTITHNIVANYLLNEGYLTTKIVKGGETSKEKIAKIQNDIELTSDEDMANEAVQKVFKKQNTNGYESPFNTYTQRQLDTLKDPNRKKPLSKTIIKKLIDDVNLFMNHPDFVSEMDTLLDSTPNIDNTVLGSRNIIEEHALADELYQDKKYGELVDLRESTRKIDVTDKIGSTIYGGYGRNKKLWNVEKATLNDNIVTVEIVGDSGNIVTIDFDVNDKYGFTKGAIQKFNIENSLHEQYGIVGLYNEYGVGSRQDDSINQAASTKVENLNSNPEAVLDFIDELAEEDTDVESLKEVVKAFGLNYLNNTKLVVDTIAKESLGTYNRETDTITISKTNLPNMVDRQDLASIFTHEYVHSLTEYALNLDIPSISVEDTKRKIYTLLRSASKILTVEDFVNDNNPDNDEALKQAKEDYDYMLTNVNDRSLNEFIAFGLTHKKISAKLKANKYKRGKDNSTLFQKLIEFFRELMGKVFISDAYNSTDKSIHDNLLQLAVSLNKHNTGAVKYKRSFIGNIIDKSDAYIAELSDSIGEAIKDKTSNIEPLADNATASDKFKFVIKSLPNMMREEERGGISTILHLMGAKYDGTIQTLIRQWSAPSEGSIGRELEQIISLRSKVESDREAVESATREMLIDAVGELSTKEDTAILDVVMDTDLVSLRDKYTVEEIHEMLGDSSKIKESIDLHKKELKAEIGNRSTYNTVITKARALGNYLNTHKIELGMERNAYNIYKGSKGNFKASGNVSVKDTTDVIDRLATLYALQGLSNTSKTLVRDKVSIDGLNTLLAQAKVIKEESLVSNFDNLKEDMIKGYTVELFDNTLDIRVDLLSNEEELNKEGYRLIVVPNNATTGIYVSEDNTRNKYVEGAVALGNLRGRGTSLSTILNLENDIGRLKRKVESFETSMKGSGVSIVPVHNTRGNIIDYRFIMSKQNKRQLLKQNTSGLQTIAATTSRIQSKVSRTKHNELVIEAIARDMEDNYVEDNFLGKNNYHYIKIGNDEDYNKDIYDILPYEMQEAINSFPQDYVAIRADLVNDYFGYKALSIMNSKFTKENLGRSAIRFLKGLSKTEEELVGIWKNEVVTKSISTLRGNLVSNQLLFLQNGYDPIKTFKDHTKAAIQITTYMKNKKLRDKLQSKNLNNTITRSETIQLKQLNEQLNSDKVIKELIDTGKFSNLVEDIDIKNKDNTGNLTKDTIEKFLGTLPEPVRNGLEAIYLSSDTAVYKTLEDILHYSDFVSKVVYHTYLLEKGVDKTTRMKIVDDAFINYDVPQAKMFEYIDRKGILPFSKYTNRVQRTIASLKSKKPVTAVSTLLLQELLGDISDVTDSFLPLNGYKNLGHNPIDMLLHIMTPAVFRELF